MHAPLVVTPALCCSPCTHGCSQPVVNSTYVTVNGNLQLVPLVIPDVTTPLVSYPLGAWQYYVIQIEITSAFGGTYEYYTCQ